MTVEYILLLSLFVFIVMGALIQGPRESFNKSGPMLGARVEKVLVTGDGFKKKGQAIQWQEPDRR